MKKMLLFACMIFAAISAFAQDVIDPSTPEPSSLIVKSDKYYLLGEQQMDEAQYVEFIQANCGAAYEAYTKANKLRTTGFILLGTGAGVFAGGLALVGTGAIISAVSGSFVPYVACGVVGAAFAGAGGGLLIASIPCIVVGSVKKNKSYEVYNEICAPSSTNVTKLEFNLQSSQDGLGIAMRF